MQIPLATQADNALAGGDYSRAEELSRRALAIDADDLAVRLTLGAALARGARYADAVEEFERVLAADPESAQALSFASVALRKLGRFEEALGYSLRACRLNPASPDPFFLAGMSLVGLGRFTEAEAELRRAASFSRVPIVLHYLGVSLTKQGKFEEATTVLEEARSKEPNQAAHLVALGQLRLERRKYSEAIRLGHRALALSPNNTAANLMVAQAMSREGLVEESGSFIQRALAADPNSAEALSLLASWQQQMGQFALAEASFDRALEIDPSLSSPLYFKVQLRKITPNDIDLVERLLSRAGASDTPPRDRMELEYALGKAFDDLGKTAEAMDHYNTANRISYETYRKTDSWDGAAFEAFTDEAIETFTKSFLEQWTAFGNPSARPIFVLGMIRSGTTLMEQMLSAHPQVAGAGELNFWMTEAVNCMDLSTHEMCPDRMKALTVRYLQLLERTSATARFVTDKMPTNVQVLGVIHANLPNAKIIFMDRDPIDTALSVWTTLFSDSPNFTNHKGHIVQALQQTERLREHWARVLPGNRLLQVRYEDLTSDPEVAMRRVLQFCDLEWNPACVHPEDNERFVSTPSLLRVRRPVDRSSVNKRARFGPYLDEFRELENLR